ncbi:MAG TPA: transporter [Terriglobales bacterium]|nr:transporter [Terriglobales bacterium]
MNKRLLFTCLALTIFHVSNPASAQFTDPRTYTNTPVGTNQLELSYTYVRGNASVDTSIIVTGAELNLHQGTIDYTRYFGLLRRLAWIEAALPVAGLGGSVAGTSIQGSTTGAGDSSYVVAMLLKGGPALSAQQFKDYEATTTVGVSLTITAPTGLYHSEKILNLGSDRWSFKPELGLSHPFGYQQKWAIDAHTNIYFYSDNASYRGRELLRQQSLPGVEGHISYSFADSLWASLDTRYSFRGATFLNGVNQDNAQQNFILGGEMNLSLNSRTSLVFEFAKALIHRNGPALVGLSVKYNYNWGTASK